MRARAAGRPQLLNYSLVSVYSRIQFGRALYPTERKGDNRYPAARYRMEEEVALAVHIPWSWLASRGNRSVAAFDKMPHLGGLISLRWTDGRTDGRTGLYLFVVVLELLELGTSSAIVSVSPIKCCDFSQVSPWIFSGAQKIHVRMRTKLSRKITHIQLPNWKVARACVQLKWHTFLYRAMRLLLS